MNRISRTGLFLIASIALHGTLHAGDLNPPMGPIAPTMQNLVALEPRVAVNSLPGSATAIHRITAPGSYYLTANITGETGKNGIEVFIPTGVERGVSIDLNGFNLVGVSGSLHGIVCNFSTHVRDGLVSFWGGNGVQISQGIVENVRVRSNGGQGIRGTWSVSIRNCTAEGNGGDGISSADNTNVFECLSKGNSGRGISIDGIGVIRDCALYNNDLGGVRCALMGQVVRCSFHANSGPAIEVDFNCRVAENQVQEGSPGILVTGGNNRIESNLLTSCNIDVNGTKNLIVRNSVQNFAGTAYDIAPGNMVGAVTADPATANEWANFLSP